MLLDLVPNHVSDQHPWFRAALAAGPGSAERERFIFRDGRGPAGGEPPNDWTSNFGGPAWTRVAEADGHPGQWYLHLFTPAQPDLDWTSQGVRDEFAAIMRFWFDLGVDGFRIDVAHGLAKAVGLPDVGPLDVAAARRHVGRAPALGPRRGARDLPLVARAGRRLRRSAGVRRRGLGAQSRAPGPLRARRRAPHRVQLRLPAGAVASRRDARIDHRTSLRAHEAVGAPPTWVLSNHDTVREVSRYARAQTGRPVRQLGDVLDLPADYSLGRRRARAAALLMLALPGGAYVYQGEELGLAEVEDLPDDVLQDPGWEQSGHTDRGRDGCRVPIPWSGVAPPFGFSLPDALSSPWLPQPAAWRSLTVEAQTGDEASMLELYRRTLRLRRSHPALGDGKLTWLPSPAGALAFGREPGFACVVNLSAGAVAPPRSSKLLISSGPLDADGRIPDDTAAWFAL